MNVPAERVLAVPRGLPGLNPLELDMSLIQEADRRLHEVRLVSHATKSELQGLYNQAANEAGKYMGWIEYEILRAKKQLTKDRSNVIMGIAMEKAKELKSLGMKMNEDLREALISQDEKCSESLDRLNSLEAVKVILGESKWSFIRAFNSISELAGQKGAQPTPNFVGEIGQTFNIPQPNFMGKDERKKE